MNDSESSTALSSLLTGASILVVDDTPANLELLVNLLGDAGYSVRPASNARFALQSVQAKKPDLILLDIRMPEIDGYEFCRRLKADLITHDIPVIFISALGDTEDKLQAFAAGGIDYITKPFQSTEVLARVRTHLSLSRIQHTLENLVLERTEELRTALHHRTQSEKLLQRTIEHFDGFIFICDRERRLEYLNPALIHHLGSDLRGRNCHEAIFHLDAPCPWCPGVSSFPAPAQRIELQNPVNLQWYDTLISPIFDPDGQLLQRQVTMIDITERKQALIDLEKREEALRLENLQLRNSLSDRYRLDGIIGRSPAMQKVYELILNAAAGSANVFITGESGTGKELVARAIHEFSQQRNQELVAVNCAAIPESLIESEFFGYRQGAFTGAEKDKPGLLDLADNSTLFLDEVGDITLTMQVKLLRVLEGHGFSPLGSNKLTRPTFRLIAATNADAKKLVHSGQMRQDFFFRIHVIPIHLPPLRDRKEDIPLLVEYFLANYDASLRPAMTHRIMEALQTHDWPGNVRELQNTLHRFVVLKQLDFIDLGADKSLKKEADDELVDAGIGLADALCQSERRILLTALRKHHWHKAKVAEALNIDVKTLYRKLKAHGLGKNHNGQA